MDVEMIVCGDVLDTLRDMPDGYVQCVMTSPPYWGLRKYSVEPRVWGGEIGCEHEWGNEQLRKTQAISDKTGLHNDGRKTPITPKYRETLDAMQPPISQGQFCCLCGAWRGDLGLEPTHESYLDHMMQVMAEVKRVLRDDGVCFVNISDTFAGSGGAHKTHHDNPGISKSAERGGVATMRPDYGIKPKSLCLIPQKFAIRCQEAGWIIRSEIIWHKPNPMPESVRDRPTRSHEQVWMLVKSQRKTRIVKLANLSGERIHFSYRFGFQSSDVGASLICVGLATSILDFAKHEQNFSLSLFDAEIREKCSGGIGSNFITDIPDEQRLPFQCLVFLGSYITTKEFLCEIQRTWIALANSNHFLITRAFALGFNPPHMFYDGKTTIGIHHSGQISKFDFFHGTIITESHSSCKYYWDQDAVREESLCAHSPKTRSSRPRIDTAGGNQGTGKPIPNPSGGRNIRDVWTIPTQCYPAAHFATFPEKLAEPCILAATKSGDVVLDPFGGSGTVGQVARRHGRGFWLIELSREYVELCHERIYGKGGK